MFDTLLASHAIGTRWTRAVTAALILHILLIAAAVSRTASSHVGIRPVARDTIRLELAEVRPSSPKGDEAPPSGPEPIIPDLPGVPDIPLGAPEFQLPTFSYSPPGRAQPRPEFFHRNSGESGGSADTVRLVFSTTEVDELPEPMDQPHPRYPDGLRRAGVSGLVQLQYVVGSDGRVDERSVRVLVSSHPGFLLAAFQALRESRFKPARRAGRPTAVLVQQTIRFDYR
jgi:periplasmic protein TonB